MEPQSLGTGQVRARVNLNIGGRTEQNQISGDGDFAIVVKDGTIQIDMVTMSTQTGKDLGGFRPDILQAVKELHPTCLRWPGGGYVAQYDWQSLDVDGL